MRATRHVRTTRGPKSGRRIVRAILATPPPTGRLAVITKYRHPSRIPVDPLDPPTPENYASADENLIRIHCG